MKIQAQYIKHTLKFTFQAGTSRGILRERDTYYLILQNTQAESQIGIGEASPLQGLSIDDQPDFESHVAQLCQRLNHQNIPEDLAEIPMLTSSLVSPNLPALHFALEVALRDLLQGGKRVIYDTPFYHGRQQLLINGLIWMGESTFMKKQIDQKLARNFSCIKMKIGAIDFEQELALLAFMRQQAPPQKLTLRVDANGAFSPEEALSKLGKLAAYQLHSIEQPIQAGQVEAMAKLCAQTPLPIALDEELIGKNEYAEKEDLLKKIRPQFIILKPTLLGGLRATEEWIEIAENLGINWWLTSALESNIGLNAICQFTSKYNNHLPQGLGTGSLYSNNIASPLTLEGELMSYNPAISWDLAFIPEIGNT